MQSQDPHYHHHHHHHHHHQHDHDQELCPQSLASGSPALGELHLLTATKARLPQVSCFIFSSSPHTPFLPPLFPYPYELINFIIKLCCYYRFFWQDFVKNLVTEGLGVELNNKVNEMNLILANHISDKVIDDVIDNLSR